MAQWIDYNAPPSNWSPSLVGTSLSGIINDDRPTGKHFTENLQFPLNVISGDEHTGNFGHYVLFYINANKKAKLDTGRRGEKGSVVDDISQAYNIPKYLSEWDSVSESYKKSKADAEEATKRVNDNIIKSARDNRYGRPEDVKVEKSNNEGSTMSIYRQETKRLQTAIALYMPASVNVTYGAQYTDTSIGAVTGKSIAAYEQFMNSNFRGAGETLLKIPEEAAQAMKSYALGIAGIFPGFGGVKESVFAAEGSMITDRLELAFKGINKRNFQYTFKMTPKNKAEAEEIRKIIFAFKANMLPEFVGGDRTGRRLVIPNTFDIQYMFNANSNNFLHHISTCVLENMSVSYGGDRYKTLPAQEDGAPPVETSVTLAFKEMELITRERVFEGY